MPLFWHTACTTIIVSKRLTEKQTSFINSKLTIMKKVLVALAMIMGLGTSVAFAGVSGDTLAVEQTMQTPQDEFTKIDVKDVPAVVINALAKDYEGAALKNAFVAEKETGKVYKVVLTVTKEDQSTEDVTVLLNEKGEIVKE